MPVEVYRPRAPQQEREKVEGPSDIDIALDRISKGLSIAANFYGIKEARDNSALKKLADDRVAAEVDRKERGILNKNELLEAQKNYDMVSAETPGALEYQMKEGPDLKKIYLKRAQAVQDPTQTEYKQLLQEQKIQKAKDDAEKAVFSKTPQGRMAGLGATEKQRLDNAKLGLISVNGMEAALKGGQNTFSLIGDNDFTQQRTLFEESLGRMQSGGAISKEEEIRFKKMAPTPWDSHEIQMKKLAQLKSEMISRLGTLGFSQEDVGIVEKSDEIAGGGLKEGIRSMKRRVPDFDRMSNEELKKYIGK